MLGWLIAAAMATAPASDAVIRSSAPLTLIPNDVSLAEAIASDGARLFTGSVVDGSLWMLERGRWRRVEADLPRGGLLSIAWDARRKLLWLGFGVAEPTAAPGKAWHGLVALEPYRFTAAHRVALPGAANPNDMTVLADGTVFASDGTGRLYRWQGGDSAERLGAADGGSPQGLAETPSGRVYLADYERGLLVLDPASGAVREAKKPTGVELRGIDGLVAWRGGLIGVQNGTRTRRILRITLDRNGNVAAVTPIEQGHPDWGEPTLIARAGRSIVYNADAQWEAWAAGGTRKTNAPPRPTPVRRLIVR